MDPKLCLKIRSGISNLPQMFQTSGFGEKKRNKTTRNRDLKEKATPSQKKEQIITVQYTPDDKIA